MHICWEMFPGTFGAAVIVLMTLLGSPAEQNDRGRR
jgi:hypothetical protein